MANCADYTMRVKGDYITIIRFLHLLNGNGPEVRSPTTDNVSYDWIGRTGHDEANVAIIHDIDFSTGNFVENGVIAEIHDYAAWSIGSIVQNCHHPVMNFCEVYGMEMEVFCREDGEGFSEYYYVDKHGEMTEDGIDHEDVGKGLKLNDEGYWDDDEFEQAYQEAFPWDFNYINHPVLNSGKCPFKSLEEIVKTTNAFWDKDENYKKLEINW